MGITAADAFMQDPLFLDLLHVSFNLSLFVVTSIFGRSINVLLGVFMFFLLCRRFCGRGGC